MSVNPVDFDHDEYRVRILTEPNLDTTITDTSFYGSIDETFIQKS